MAEIVGARLEWLIEDRRTSQSAVAREIGVSQPSIGRLISGETRETGKLIELARALRTTPEFLIGETDESDSGAVQGHRLGLRGAEPATDPDIVELDEIDLRYGLGGTYIDGPVQSVRRQFSRTWLRNFTRASPEHLFWTIGDGDSMEPTIRSGEVILIDRSDITPRTGDAIWACAYGHVGMIKRLCPLPDGTVEILSDNDRVPTRVAADGELHVIGRVVAVVRRL